MSKDKVVIALCQRFLCPYSYPINSMIFTLPEEVKGLECLFGHKMLMKVLD
jgi:hypothetical protein